MISLDTVKEFQVALKEEFGNDLSLEQAGLILSDLVGYFDTLLKVDYQSKTDTNDAII